MPPSAAVTSASTAFSRSSNSPRHDGLVAQALGHVAVDDAQGQALDDGGLADAGLADQDGVVLGAAGEDLDGAADLLVAADDRVDLAVAGGQGQVAGVAFEGVIGVFGAGAVGGLALADLGDGGVEGGGGRADGFQDLGRHAALPRDGAEQAFGGDEGVAGLFRGLLGGGEDAGGVAVEIDLAVAAGDLGALLEGGFGRGLGPGRVAAGGGDQIAGEAVALFQQHLEQVFGGELLMSAGEGQRLGGLDGLFGAVGIEVEIHGGSPDRRIVRSRTPFQEATP